MGTKLHIYCEYVPMNLFEFLLSYIFLTMFDFL